MLPVFSLPLDAQTGADPTLATEIAKIKAIDNHTHVMRVVGPGEEDHEYDALPFELLEPFPLMVRPRPDDLDYTAAWRAVYGYKHSDMSEAHVREVSETKVSIRREHGDGYPTGCWPEITRERALELARLVLRENAVKVCGF